METIAYYDLLHLLKYYDLSWFKSVKEFQETLPNSENIQFADLYCQVKRAKNREDNLIVSFSLESEFNQDIFKKRYCDKQTAIRGLKIQVSNLDSSCVALSPKLTEAIKEQYITCLLVPEQGGTFGEIKGKTRDIQLSCPTVKVIFSNSKIVNYKAILGTNAYLIGAKIQKYLYAIQKKTEYWVC
ncbi:hypothetical protein [Geminocystis sp. NIES-3709]|uniref:hypothetical protein n=1 Tax=Geminocystis sp. NIES-3709 TaxID=1617448 RepID=UPI0005FC9E65|nr:hypothetical protein [Geminocystis sp. NIES-3709]BAQ65846.1 hypothetical protein GM3709_2611 [Geminocystis sp. NIES-3709]